MKYYLIIYPETLDHSMKKKKKLLKHKLRVNEGLRKEAES